MCCSSAKADVGVASVCFDSTARSNFSRLPKRQTMGVSRCQRYIPTNPNRVRRLDFVGDQLVDGTRLRALTIGVAFSWEALAIVAGNGCEPKMLCRVETARRSTQRSEISLCLQRQQAIRPRAGHVGLSLQSSDRLQSPGKAHGQLPH